MGRENISNWLDQNNDYDPTKVKKKGVIYIAGPMRNYPDLNFEAFRGKAEELREDGWVVMDPSETPMGLKSPKAYIMIDIAILLECDAIYMLNGWKKSKGARVEFALAEFLGLEIIYEGK